MPDPSGTLLLLGGADLGDPTLAQELVRASRGPKIKVLPIGRAFEGPEAAVVAVAEWLGPLGAEVEGVMALTRSDAEHEELAARLDDADAIYLTDGAALHIRTVLKDTKLHDHLRGAFEGGATVIASGAAASALCDPMVDPRGGAPTVGLGFTTRFMVVPHADGDPDDPNGEKLHRTVTLASADHVVIALGARSGVMLTPDQRVTLLGAQELRVFRGGVELPQGLASL